MIESLFYIYIYPWKQPLKQDEDRLEEEIKSGAVVDAQEAMAQELQLAELLSNEYSLEEIIYQLARILFSQSLSQVKFISILD